MYAESSRVCPYVCVCVEIEEERKKERENLFLSCISLLFSPFSLFPLTHMNDKRIFPRLMCVCECVCVCVCRSRRLARVGIKLTCCGGGPSAPL